MLAVFSQVLDLWQSANSDGRSLLARSLFQRLVVNLEKQQIVDFRLHPWADQDLMIRADLYSGDSGVNMDADDVAEISGNDTQDTEFEGNKNRFTT